MPNATYDKCIGVVYILNKDNGHVYAHSVLFNGVHQGLPIYSIDGYVYGLTMDELWEELQGFEFKIELDQVCYEAVKRGDGIYLQIEVGPPI